MGTLIHQFNGGVAVTTLASDDFLYMTDKSDAQSHALKPFNPPFTVDADGLIFEGTDRVRLPVGTDAQRPGTPADGDLRVNSDQTTTEIYRDGAWRNLEGSMVVGNAVTGGDNTAILYVDGSGDLATDANHYISGGTLVTRNTAGSALSVVNAQNNASVKVGGWYGDRDASAANNDTAYWCLFLADGAANQQETGRISWIITDITDTSEDAEIFFSTAIAGSLTEILRLTGTGTKITNHAYQATNTNNVVSANAVTIDLSAGNHQSLDLGAATGTVTATLTAPSGPSGGTLVIKQDASPRDITWVAGTGITNGVWLGTEPTWASDTANLRRILSWRFDGTNLLLAVSSEETATF